MIFFNNDVPSSFGLGDCQTSIFFMKVFSIGTIPIDGIIKDILVNNQDNISPGDEIFIIEKSNNIALDDNNKPEVEENNPEDIKKIKKAWKVMTEKINAESKYWEDS